MKKLCLDWDPEAEAFVRKVCPYRKAGLKGQVNYISNAVVRSLQDQMPRSLPAHTKYECSLRNVEGNKEYWKEPGSKSWTPLRILRIPQGLALRIQAACVRNEYDLAHPKYGCDVLIKFDGEAAPERMYDLRVKERTELTQQELNYLRYPVDIVKPETLEKATKEWAKLQPRLVRDGWQKRVTQI